MAYHIYLDLFEGPMELLLFLVTKAQIDIKDIFLSKVTGQYLEFVNALQDNDMDRASEFIHMAARLLEIKSRKLLPKPRIEEEEDEDPEQMLIRQLEDFRMMKEAGDKLIVGHEIAQNRFYRQATEQLEKIQLDLSNVTVETLQDAFENLMLIMELEPDLGPVRNIQREEITVEDKINSISRVLRIGRKITFKELFCNDVSKYEVVTTFMALLEMLKLNLILVNQLGPREQLIISLRKKGA